MPGTTLSPEDKLNYARNAINRFAPDFDCVVYVSNPTYKTNETEADGAPVDGELSGYGFHFTRCYVGIPTTYRSYDCIGYDEETNVGHACQYYEGIKVIVSEYGLEDMFWAPQYDIVSTIGENTCLLSFEQVMDITSNILLNIYYFGKEENGVSTEVDINHITFGYTRVQMKEDPSRFMMVPAWDFFGDRKVF